MKKLLFALACVALSTSALCLTGCENSIEAGIDAWKSPDAGTTLIFGNTIIRTTSGDTTTDVTREAFEITASELEMWGEHNVYVAIGPDQDSIVFAVMDNGNLAFGDSNAEGIQWEVWPTGSKKTMLIRDTDIVSNGTDHEVWKTTRRYLGEEDITIADKDFYTVKVMQEETLHEYSSLWDYTTTALDTLYFSPDLGYIIRQHSSAITYEYDSISSTYYLAKELQGYIKR